VAEIRGERARRALKWMAVAGLGLLAAGIVYLRPSLNAPTAPAVPRAGASQPVGPPVFFSVSFGDSEHGAVQVFRQTNQPDRPPPIYLTSDGGRTWRPLAKPTDPIAAITFVGRRRMLAEQFGRGIPRLLVSDDGGRTWQPLANDPRQFIIGPSWPVFQGSEGWWLDWQPFTAPGSQPSAPAGIWHTSDGGRTWARLAASGIPRFANIDRVRFVDQRHGLLALTSADDQGRAMIVATSDGGVTWEPAATFDTHLPGTRPFGILLLQHGTRLLAWLAVSSLNAPALRFPGESLVTNTFTSVSEDGGATWGPLRPGPVTTASPTAVMDDKGRLLLLDGHRLWISEDGGATWAARVAVMPQGLTPFLVAGVPGSLYAVAVQSSDVPRLGNAPAPAALLRSADGGIHWTEVRLPRS
jgi:photosystem II stability/assembly factor-like uncharacterized protein